MTKNNIATKFEDLKKLKETTYPDLRVRNLKPNEILILHYQLIEKKMFEQDARRLFKSFFDNERS